MDINSIDTNAIYLNRIKFSPVKHNCIIDCNRNGIVELISVQIIKTNEEIVCWFSEVYLTKIKSKIKSKVVL